MLFDKSFVYQAVKSGLNVAEQAQQKKQRIALLACLDDISLRLQSDSHLSIDTLSVNAGDRSVEITGENFDLRSIYYLRLAIGSDNEIVEFKDQKDFVSEFDTIDAVNGMPTHYTFLESSDGFATIKFSCPLSSSGSLYVYFLKVITPESMQSLSNVSPIIQGTLAYFLGVETTRGAPFYRAFEKLMALMMGNHKLVSNTESNFKLNEFDQDTKIIQGDISRSRN